MPFTTKSVIVAEQDIVSVAAQETEICLAAAKAFELRMHVDAIMASIGGRTKQFADAGTIVRNPNRLQNCLRPPIELWPQGACQEY